LEGEQWTGSDPADRRLGLTTAALLHRRCFYDDDQISGGKFFFRVQNIGVLIVVAMSNLETRLLAAGFIKM
jgi:hypothetical protein